jgi:hypothetical protein
MKMDILVGFGSLVVIPFLGILNMFKVRAFPYLSGFLAVWLILGALIVGGGVTPINKGDIIMHDERQVWFDRPEVDFINKLWLVGLALGLPLLIITGLYEHSNNVATVLKQIKKIATVTSFVGSLLAFIKLFIIPLFFP